MWTRSIILDAIGSVSRSRSWKTVWHDTCAVIRGGDGLSAMLVAIALLGAALFTMQPPHAWDELAYHLSGARRYVENGALIPNDYLRYPVFPQNMEMMYAAALLIGDSSDAHAMHFLALCITTIWVYDTACQISTNGAAAWCSALLVANPILLRNATVSYADVGVAHFVCASACAYLRWKSYRETIWLIMCGLFAGFAAGTKYTGLVFMLVIGSAIIATSPNNNGNTRRANFIIWAICGSAVCAHWYAYNWAWSDNPVFPFLRPIFGGRYWSDEDYVGQMHDLTRVTGSQWSEIWKWPIGLTYDPLSIRSDGAFSAAWLWASPLAIVGLFFKSARTVLAIGIGYIGLQMCMVRVPRYMIAAVPCMALGVGIAAHTLTSSIVKVLWKKRFIQVIVTAVLIWPAFKWMREQLRVSLTNSGGAIPLKSDARHRWVTARIPDVSLLDNLNTTDRLYNLFASDLAYYCKGPFLGDWFGDARYSIIYDIAASRYRYPSDVMPWMQEHGVSHIMIRNTGPIIRFPDSSDGWDDVLRIVGGRVHSRLYEIVWSGKTSPPQFQRSMITNSIFSNVTIKPGDSISQRSETEIGELYLVSVDPVLSGKADARVDVIMEWNDAVNNRVLDDKLSIRANAEAKAASMLVTAPRNAVRAHLRITNSGLAEVTLGSVTWMSTSGYSRK